MMQKTSDATFLVIMLILKTMVQTILSTSQFPLADIFSH